MSALHPSYPQLSRSQGYLQCLDLVNTINRMIDQLAIFAAEVKKVAREVGTEGKLGGQAEVGNVEGIWQEITYVFN